jgi:TetR/AcrR family transcriptional regulator
MKRERNKQEKRMAILKAALAEFSGKRFDVVKLDGIAAKAGVGKGTLYLYFKSKEDLFIQMALDGVEQMATRIREVAAMDGDFRERFFLIGGEIGQFVRKRTIMFQLVNQIDSDSVREEFIQQHRLLIKAAREFLQDGMSQGVLRSDVTVADLHCMLIGPLLFRVRLNRFNNDNIDVETLLKLFWAASALKEQG